MSTDWCSSIDARLGIGNRLHSVQRPYELPEDVEW